MYWNNTIETMEHGEMRQLQTKRLGDVVEYMYRQVPFYRSRMQEKGFIATRYNYPRRY